MHLADAFIQSDLLIHVLGIVHWELNPQPFALLTQWATGTQNNNKKYMKQIYFKRQ